MPVQPRLFGTTADGVPVHAVTLSNGALRATILTYGATVQDVRLAGVPWPLTLGSDQVSAYEGAMRFAGALVGPVANRIAGARATLDGRTLHFEANERGRTALHGGWTGTYARHWRIADLTDRTVRMELDLADGDGGYPGNRTIAATYEVSDPAVLSLHVATSTDAPTLVNMANHSYWNLDGRADTAGHTLQIAADHYLPVDADLIPDGPPAPVAGSDFDLRAGRVLDRVARYDHNFCLAAAARPLTEVAILTGRSGTRMRLATTEPGLQVYDAGGFDTGHALGLTGQPYGAFAGIALEAQGWPDAPNRDDFPSVRLGSGETRRQLTRLSFDRG